MLDLVWQQEEAERRRRLSAMQGSLQALKAANQERSARQSTSQQRLTFLHVSPRAHAVR